MYLPSRTLLLLNYQFNSSPIRSNPKLGWVDFVIPWNTNKDDIYLPCQIIVARRDEAPLSPQTPLNQTWTHCYHITQNMQQLRRLTWCAMFLLTQDALSLGKRRHRGVNQRRYPPRGQRLEREILQDHFHSNANSPWDRFSIVKTLVKWPLKCEL